jgi:hypothetical protein
MHDHVNALHSRTECIWVCEVSLYGGYVGFTAQFLRNAVAVKHQAEIMPGWH